MRAPIYKNREFLRLVVAVCIIWLVITGLLITANHFTWARANAQLVQRNIGLLGNLLAANPSLGSEEAGLVVQAFAGEASMAAMEAGRELAARYGYDEDYPLSSTPILSRWYTWGLVASIGLGLIAHLFLVAAVYISSDRTYRRLSEYSLGAERIMRGDYSVRFPEAGDGELSILGFQFNQLSRRLQMSFSALEEEKQQMRDMISGISHQLKTPLASSRVFAELLLEGAGEDPEIRQEFLHKNLTQLERMEWLIQALLKLSRLESGVIEFKRENANLAETVKEVVLSLAEKAKDKGQTLSFQSCCQTVLAPHDQHWLAEAVTNIIDNALRYSPAGGRVTASLDQTDSTAVIRIADTGPGIHPYDLPRIFQRFYQGRNRAGGSGIGLALAKLIVEKHGGVIEAANVMDRGSIFTISLPRVWLP